MKEWGSALGTKKGLMAGIDNLLQRVSKFGIVWRWLETPSTIQSFQKVLKGPASRSESTWKVCLTATSFVAGSWGGRHLSENEPGEAHSSKCCLRGDHWQRRGNNKVSKYFSRCKTCQGLKGGHDVTGLKVRERIIDVELQDADQHY